MKAETSVVQKAVPMVSAWAEPRVEGKADSRVASTEHESVVSREKNWAAVKV